ARRSKLGHFQLRWRRQHQLAWICRGDLRFGDSVRFVAARIKSAGGADNHRSIPDAGTAADELGARLSENCRDFRDLTAAVANEPPSSGSRAARSEPGQIITYAGRLGTGQRAVHIVF